ncbi:hypothetical protein FACS1894111_11170 [Clostridia bacterium]|nr:hypothetical protein FACS1894111_11170 [Clostridia bacterium]
MSFRQESEHTVCHMSQFTILAHLSEICKRFFQSNLHKKFMLIPKVSSTMEFDVEFNLERISGRI